MCIEDSEGPLADMAPATASSVSAGRMAVRALLNAATPTGSESTPEPTMDLTRFAVLADSPALPSSSAAAAAAATNVVARSTGRGATRDESGRTCSAVTPQRARRQSRLRKTDPDIAFRSHGSRADLG